MSIYRVPSLTCALLASALVLAGCAAGPTSPPPTAASAHSAATVPVTDCSGTTTHIAAPSRIVTANTAGLELLIRLGAADKVIGTGWAAGAASLPDDVRATATKVPALAARSIPKEQLLTSGAQVYLDAFGVMKMMGGDAPTDADFAAANMTRIYLRSSACTDTARADLASVYTDIEALGRLTGTEAKATSLIDDMKATIAAAQRAKPATAPSMFYYALDPTGKGLTTLGSRQLGNGIYTLAGVRNVFGQRDEAMTAVSWEDVAATDPDWIQVAVRNQASAEATSAAERKAIADLSTNPKTKDLRAVRAGHVFALGAEETTLPGVANADAVATIIRAVTRQ